MAKLTKAQSKAHRQAEELLTKDVLTLDEKAFVYQNWNEAALHDNTRSGAYFTPMGLANDFKLEVPGPRILDNCAGIGILSFCKLHFQWHDSDRMPQFTCVEINPDYVRVGKKLLPEATWICADIFDIWHDLPRDFTTAIANPPFGNIRHAGRAPRYSGPEFEYKIIDIAAHLASYGGLSCRNYQHPSAIPARNIISAPRTTNTAASPSKRASISKPDAASTRHFTAIP